MYIKSKKSFGHDGKHYVPGQVYEVADSLGERFVSIGHAEKVNSKTAAEAPKKKASGNVAVKDPEKAATDKKAAEKTDENPEKETVDKKAAADKDKPVKEDPENKFV